MSGRCGLFAAHTACAMQPESAACSRTTSRRSGDFGSPLPRSRFNVTAWHRVIAAGAALVGALSAQAHGADPAAKIEVACPSGAVHMSAIGRAVKDSHFWASQTARRRMLSLAQLACARGATAVTFVPPAEQRSCRTTPAWSTLCLDVPAPVPGGGSTPDESLSAHE